MDGRRTKSDHSDELKISVANMVDIAVACFIDFALASSRLERAATNIDSCCRYMLPMKTILHGN